MSCWRFLTMVFVLTLLVMVSGCGGPPSIDTGSGTKQSSQAGTQQGTGKKISINKNWTINGLEIIIGEMEISSDKVKIGMTLNNKSETKLTFHPDGSNSVAVIGDIQLESNTFMTEGKLSGEIYPGVSKSGVIFFTVPKGKSIAPNNIKAIDLHLGDIYESDHFSNSKEFNAMIDLAQSK